jgi:hypothetical protein
MQDSSTGHEDAEFDPGAVAAGDSVGGLEIVALDVRRVFDDSVWAGRVDFRGRLRVDGVYRRLFDYPEPAALCFHVRGDARKRVPRFTPDNWTGPNRQTWFCFTMLLDRMEAAGLIVRARDAEDRRFVTTRITEEGVRLVAETEGPVMALHGSQFHGVSERDLRQLVEVLAQVRDAGRK